MDLWFSENHTKDLKLSIKVDRQVYSAKSFYQQIDIFDTPEFGRMLVLDDCVMITERDEFMYHEMLTHVPMAVKPDVKDVLVIGGGDGGVVRELTKYDTVEHIDLCEIDEVVVMACRKYIPQTAAQLDDPRVTIHYEDGLPFVRRVSDKYDLIIVDSTDPFGPGEGLFTREFYGSCKNALHSDGILVNQHESAFYEPYAESMQTAHKKLKRVFKTALVYRTQTPTYPSGVWHFGFASNGIDPVTALDADAWNALNIKTNYYNTDIHRAAFVLPNYVKRLLED